jgi:hypothetical protein
MLLKHAVEHRDDVDSAVFNIAMSNTVQWKSISKNKQLPRAILEPVTFYLFPKRTNQLDYFTYFTKRKLKLNIDIRLINIFVSVVYMFDHYYFRVCYPTGQETHRGAHAY